MNISNLINTKAITSIAALTISTLAMTLPALADAPNYVRVRSVTYAGSGCPAGTLAQNLSPDRQAFDLHFDSYIAEAGPWVSVSEKRKNCVINLDMDYPQGWSFALAGVEYRGYADLDPGVNALQTTSLYFSGQSGTAKLRSTLTGPTSTDFQIRDSFGLGSTLWSPCGVNRSLNINTQVYIDNSRNRRGSGLVTVDRINTVTTHRYGLLWKRCR
jgi:hypothetical protein